MENNDLEKALALKEEGSEVFDDKPLSLGKIIPPQEQERQDVTKRGDEQIAQSGFVPTNSLKVRTPLGWNNISMEDLPSKGKFYPIDTILQIRSAGVPEIEHYSTMNENDMVDIDTHLNDILRSCAKLVSDTDRNLNIMDLIEGDRIFVILSIKDKTFTETENIINLDITCNKGHENKRELKNNILNSNSESDESIEKYYDAVERCYNIKTKSYGIIKMRPPRIGLVEYIYSRGRNHELRNTYWNKSYFTILPYLFPNASGPIKDIDIDMFYADYTKWDKTKYAVVYRMADKIKIGTDPIVEIKCSECGEVARSPFRVPGGTKSLFVIQNIDDELL